MFCLHLYLWITCSLSTHRAQKHVLDFLELELLMIIRIHVSAGNQTWVLWKESSALNHWAESPTPDFEKKKKKILCLYLVISIFLQLLSTQFKIITMVRFSPNSGMSITPPYLMLVELSSYMTCYLPLCMPSSLCPNERHCTFYSPHRRTFYSYKYP